MASQGNQVPNTQPAEQPSSIQDTRTIIVASQNPVKIDAARQGFQAMFPDINFVVRSMSVPSGVPDQPFSDQETFRGATNRAFNACTVLPQADFWVGIEGGVCHDPNEEKVLQSFAWVVVLGKSLDDESPGRAGKARTATYYLPEETSTLVKGGKELGDAEDLLWGQTNSKQQNGSVGLLTGDVVDRKGYMQQAVVLALIPFKNPKLTF
ncbi:NTPase [Apodospora peruviana]|uniref:inosine/xanthosine triphosphatase n=1 Tax=Apodospora peruviana TaxID=516989 RepID=A0AAE0HZM6_9PEZI|nr:NTPase [Apodospora peruviana]